MIDFDENISPDDIVWTGSVCRFCGDALMEPEYPNTGTIHNNGLYACHVYDDKGKAHRLNTVATKF